MSNVVVILAFPIVDFCVVDVFVLITGILDVNFNSSRLSGSSFIFLSFSSVLSISFLYNAVSELMLASLLGLVSDMITGLISSFVTPNFLHRASEHPASICGLI